MNTTKALEFHIFEAFQYPGITGQNLPLSRKIPGFNYLFKYRKINDIKLILILIFSMTFFFSIDSYLCKKNSLKSWKNIQIKLKFMKNKK